MKIFPPICLLFYSKETITVFYRLRLPTISTYISNRERRDAVSINTIFSISGMCPFEIKFMSVFSQISNTKNKKNLTAVYVI